MIFIFLIVSSKFLDAKIPFPVEPSTTSAFKKITRMWNSNYSKYLSSWILPCYLVGSPKSTSVNFHCLHPPKPGTWELPDLWSWGISVHPEICPVPFLGSEQLVFKPHLQETKDHCWTTDSIASWSVTFAGRFLSQRLNFSHVCSCNAEPTLHLCRGNISPRA